MEDNLYLINLTDLDGDRNIKLVKKEIYNWVMNDVSHTVGKHISIC